MKFSIIIPTFNRSHLISIAIKSVLDQTFSDWELIIVDDGSTDNTKEIVSGFKDERIKYIYQKNSERSAARNRGIEHANSGWICFLDSDDKYLPDHLETLNNELCIDSLPRLIVTGTLIQVNGQLKKNPLINSESHNVLMEIWTKFILMNSVCVHFSILQNNHFDIRYKYWEDTHLWLRIAAQFPFQQIEKYTTCQISNEEGTVNQSRNNLTLDIVNQAINSIKDLRDNYENIFIDKLKKTDFNNHIDSKYRNFLYINRQCKNVYRSFVIWLLAMFNKPSWYLVTELPKIFMNKLGIGISKNDN